MEGDTTIILLLTIKHLTTVMGSTMARGRMAMGSTTTAMGDATTVRVSRATGSTTTATGGTMMWHKDGNARHGDGDG